MAEETTAATEKKGVAEQRVLKEQIKSSIMMLETQGDEMDAGAKRKGDECKFKLTRANLLHQGERERERVTVYLK